MTTGFDILKEVQYLTDDPSYSRYVEINRAYRTILKTTAFNWLRKTSTDLISFEQDVSTYTLDTANIRRIQSIWVKGGTNQNWTKIEEVPPQLFEEKVADSITQEGDVNTNRPIYFKLEEGPNPVVTISPTPDTSYTCRVDYIENAKEINRSSLVNIPTDYFDIISHMAAGFILERLSDPERKQLGQTYISRSVRDIDNMIKDTHPNRIKSITTKPAKWYR